MAEVSLLEDGTEVCIPLPGSFSDSDEEEVQQPVAETARLEDGTEVCIPLPGSFSDSDEEPAGLAKATVAEAATEPTVSNGRAAAWAALANGPGHDHSRRELIKSEALAAFAGLEPAPEQRCEVLDCGISAEEFSSRFVAGEGRPAVLKGVPQAEAWPAAERWRSQSAFLARYGKLNVQVTEMSALHGLGRPFRVELPIEDYVGYAATNVVDWPYYIWERKFDGERGKLLEDFSAPKVLQDDLYDSTPEIRQFLPLSCHLFVLVGGRRTGSNMHRDPKWSSAWNTLLVGRKRWVLFPRERTADEIGALTGDAYKDGGPPAYWWLDHYPRLRETGKELGMVDIVQGPGDTVFIPAGWWHATLNLPDDGEDVTVACTRNVVPPASMGYVLPRMRAADPAFTCNFLATLRRLRPDAGSFLPEEEAAREKFALLGDDESWQLRRREADGLSLAECRREFVRKGKPLLIEGLHSQLLSKESCGLSWEWLSEHFGEKMLGAYRNFSAPELRKGQEDRSELLRLREVLALMRKGGEEAEGLYAYDISMPLQLPGLLEHVLLPRYFAHCYLQQTMRPHCFSRSWPTLFLGTPGSQSRLHVDQWHGHFWMHLISGRKRWTIFHPEDAHLLSPTVPPGKHHPVFPDLASIDSSQARRLEFVLEEGETLFVPGGAPHLVVNLTNTVAVAGNFLDESNFEKALTDIKAMAANEAEGGAMTGVAAALGEMDFDPERGMHEELLPARHLVLRYSDFAGGKAASWGPVPPWEGDEP